MTKVLITGATGNVGREVVAALQKLSLGLEMYAAVRDWNQAIKHLQIPISRL